MNANMGAAIGTELDAIGSSVSQLNDMLSALNDRVGAFADARLGSEPPTKEPGDAQLHAHPVFNNGQTGAIRMDLFRAHNTAIQLQAKIDRLSQL